MVLVRGLKDRSPGGSEIWRQLWILSVLITVLIRPGLETVSKISLQARRASQIWRLVLDGVGTDSSLNQTRSSDRLKDQSLTKPLLFEAVGHAATSNPPRFGDSPTFGISDELPSPGVQNIHYRLSLIVRELESFFDPISGRPSQDKGL